METVINNRIEHPVRDGVLNYLNMNTSGALLVTGNWGCGKTYFFKNTLFEEIDKEANYIPIMVSLFGLKELRELPERVLYAYFDKVGKNVTSLGKLTQIAKNLAEALPIVKDYVDIDKLLGTGNGLYRIIPNNVLICFDDIERAIEIIDINEILGIINELVENKGYKVIVIANESFISQKDNGKQLIFKEKVIEKTLVYIPNIVSLFKEITASYNNPDFVDFMSDIDIIKSINPTEESLAKFPNLRKCLSNIRIIKFTIEHFYRVFLHYQSDGNSYKENSIVKRKLKNYWTFILAVSIEYKLNNLSFEDNRTLDTHQSIANIDFGYENEVVFEESEEGEENKQEKNKEDEKYANLFFKKFFLRISEEPIFHKELYDFVTAGSKIDYIVLDENMNQKINIKDNKINPAHELLNQFVHGYWKFKNGEVVEKLSVLLEYTKSAQFEDYTSYINATVYLFAFRELLITISDDILIKEIKDGINKFSENTQANYLVKTHMEMAASYLKDDTKWVFDYIMERIDLKINAENKKEEEALEMKFHDNLESFLQEFSPTDSYTTPKYFGIPILKNFDREKITTRVQQMEPYDAMFLRNFIEERYVKTPSGQIKEEVVFLNAINEGIDGIDEEKKNMTNIIVRTLLRPTLDKALRIIEAM